MAALLPNTFEALLGASNKEGPAPDVAARLAGANEKGVDEALEEAVDLSPDWNGADFDPKTDGAADGPEFTAFELESEDFAPNWKSEEPDVLPSDMKLNEGILLFPDKALGPLLAINFPSDEDPDPKLNCGMPVVALTVESGAQEEVEPNEKVGFDELLKPDSPGLLEEPN